MRSGGGVCGALSTEPAILIVSVAEVGCVETGSESGDGLDERLGLETGCALACSFEIELSIYIVL